MSLLFTTLAIVVLALLALILMGYLAACAGAGCWLSFCAWFWLIQCDHDHVRLLSIGWDGQTRYQCLECEKRFTRSL